MIIGKLYGREDDESEGIFLGITGENVTRLVAGEPLKIPPSKLKELGLPEVTIVIHYGRKEEDILKEINAHQGDREAPHAAPGRGRKEAP